MEVSGNHSGANHWGGMRCCARPLRSRSYSSEVRPHMQCLELKAFGLSAHRAQGWIGRLTGCVFIAWIACQSRMISSWAWLTCSPEDPRNWPGFQEWVVRERACRTRGFQVGAGRGLLGLRVYLEVHGSSYKYGHYT